MSKKLLNKTLRNNLVFSVVVLLVAAPFFYFVTQRLYLEETDETLNLKKHGFLKDFHSHFTEMDIPMWNRINRDLKISKNTAGILRDTLFFHTYFDSIEMENEYCRTLLSPFKIDGNGYILEAKVSLVEADDLIENIAILFLAILFILLVGFYFITRIYSGKLWQPFYETLESIEQFEIDKDSQPALRITNIEEFNRLNQAITILTERNMAIYKSQREFVENAAHELQTPLAVFQAKIDTLIQRSDITEEQAEILNQLNDGVARLNKLNKNLLLLSKIDSNQFSEIEIVAINDIFNRQLPFFKEQAGSRNIAIDIEHVENVSLNSNQVLAEVLINNLFLNAIRHNIKDGHIQIRLTAKALVFSNTGIDQSLDAGRLFERFAKVNPSTSGNGLGLAIIRKIAVINDWSVTYKFENNLHVFEIIF